MNWKMKSRCMELPWNTLVSLVGRRMLVACGPSGLGNDGFPACGGSMSRSRKSPRSAYRWHCFFVSPGLDSWKRKLGAARRLALGGQIPWR